MKPSTVSMALAMPREEPASLLDDVERLVEAHWTPVLRFVFASVRDMEVAETLTQDCLWKAHRTRHLFRGDCSVHTWLIRIALNLIRDHSRRRRWQFWRQVRPLSNKDVSGCTDRRLSPEAAAIVNDQVNAVWKATGTLPDKQRTVFLLRFVEDLDIAEIAIATGLSENAVQVNVFRAIRRIRKQLETAS
jgi:RNA polymerase sigma-70 factor, ECF subfamily